MSRNTLKWTNGRVLPLIRGVSGAKRELCDPLQLIRSSSQVKAEVQVKIRTDFLLLLLVAVAFCVYLRQAVSECLCFDYLSFLIILFSGGTLLTEVILWVMFLFWKLNASNSVRSWLRSPRAVFESPVVFLIILRTRRNDVWIISVFSLFPERPYFTRPKKVHKRLCKIRTVLSQGLITRSPVLSPLSFSKAEPSL